MHVHAHGGEHDHAHGLSGHEAGVSRGFFFAAMAATLALVAAELLGGYFGHSIALVSDAVHKLSDVPALLISWLAMLLSQRPADSQRTYGYRRAGTLAAFTNSILLVLVALGLFYEAFDRFRHPVAVRENWMIAVSIAALLVNGGITLALLRARHDLNLRSVLIHNLGDALSNAGILAGAFVMRATGARWLDPAMGAAIGVLVLWSTWGVLKESGNILLEGLPKGLDVEHVARAILAVEGVREVHDIHIWTIGTGLHALSCHVRIPDMHMGESEKILAAIQQRLTSEFHISHVTVQFERAGLPKDAGLFMPKPFQPVE
ncbi:MAG: cation diffusion facilitator family transporter [Candidatus Acidiferrales bacterium]